jgi:hypothetical protein
MPFRTCSQIWINETVCVRYYTLRILHLRILPPLSQQLPRERTITSTMPRPMPRPYQDTSTSTNIHKERDRV